LIIELVISSYPWVILSFEDGLDETKALIEKLLKVERLERAGGVGAITDWNDLSFSLTVDVLYSSQLYVWLKLLLLMRLSQIT
jgi:hypothetical protein